MTVISVVIIILIIFDLRILQEQWKHEQAICDLLRLHPELLEEDDDG